jgi:hypothetical protein
MWDGINTHVWATESNNISNLSWHVTFLSNVSGEETTLRKTNDVEFTSEGLIIFDFLARLLSNFLEIIDDRSNHWHSNLDALNLGTSSMSEHEVELDVTWLHAEVAESVEHGSWYAIRVLWGLNVEWASWILWLLHLGVDLRLIGEKAHDWAFASVLIVVSWVEHLGSGLIGKIFLLLLLPVLKEWVLLLALKGFDMGLQLVALLIHELDLAPRGVLLDGLEWMWDMEPRVLLSFILDLVKMLWDFVLLMMTVVVEEVSLVGWT